MWPPSRAAEIARITIRDHRDAASRDRHEPLGRRQPHQHLRVVDRRRAFDAEAIAVEQQRQVAETQMIGEAERAPVGSLVEIGRKIAQDDIALAEAQMGEQAFHVGDAFERAEHHDDVALGRRLGRKITGAQIAPMAARFLPGRSMPVYVQPLGSIDLQSRAGARDRARGRPQE